jgi:4-amino-4-deoxy-L-arabinose transferase-like glycosyltransferase
MALLPAATPAAPGYPVARRHVLIVLLCIVLLALGLRLYHIDALPYSLWRDEARHGQVALRMLENPDYRPVYEPRWGIDLPGLGFYPFALALRLWGIHAWSLRVMTAIAGALTVLPLYALVACLTARRDVALLAAALLAVSSWHISISRLSFPTIFEPLLTLTALWLLLHTGMSLVRGAATRTPVACGAFGVAGALLGMAAQTYHTGRMAPLLAGVLLLALFAGSRAAPPAWSRWRWLLLVGSLCLGFLLVTAPLLWYAITHPHDFQSRVGAVFLLSEEARRARAPLAVLDESLGRHLLMFNVHGDANGRHHAPGQPLLDVVSGAGFVVGCGLLLWQWRNWRAGFLLVALSIGVLPSLLAVEGPHAMRSIGAAAFACAIAAIGWGTAAHLGWQRLRHRVYLGWGGFSRALLAGVVVLALLLNVHTYFVDMAQDRAVWASSYPVHTRIGSYLRQVAEREGSTALERIYIPEHLSRNAVLGYLTHGLPVRTFDTATLAHTVEPGSMLVLSGYTYRHDVADLQRSLVLSPQPVQYGAELPGTGEPSFVVYRVLQAGQ